MLFLALRILSLSLLVSIGSIGSVAAQQRYACPTYSSQVRQKVIAGMVDKIRKGRPYHGCANRAEGALDVECELTLNFYLGALGYGQSRPFNAPWSAWVTCFPELNAVKALNDEALAQELEAKKYEAKEVEQRRRELQARESDPRHVLTRTYYDYIMIRKCFDQRQGYLAVNISDQEMVFAKTAAKGIEDFIQKTNPAIDKESAWKLANSDSVAWMTDADQTELTLAQYNDQFQLDPSDRNRCQKILQSLVNRYKQLSPESTAVKKDF